MSVAVRGQAAGAHVIQPRTPGLFRPVTETWRHRRLLPFFCRNFLQKRYAGTWLGWLWLPLRPVLEVVARIVVFGGILKAPSEGVPYALFFLVGWSVWHVFAVSLTLGTRSLELNRRFLKRLYIPRLTLIVASATPGLVDYFFYWIMTAMVLAYFLVVDGTTHLVIGPETVLAPVGFALVLLIAWSVALWTSIFAAQARDVRFGLRYVLGFWFYFTPVIYPLSAVPEKFQTVAALNPMTAPIEWIRMGLLGVGHVPPTAVASTGVFLLIVGLAGMSFFSRAEVAALDSI